MMRFDVDDDDKKKREKRNVHVGYNPRLHTYSYKNQS